VVREVDESDESDEAMVRWLSIGLSSMAWWVGSTVSRTVTALGSLFSISYSSFSLSFLSVCCRSRSVGFFSLVHVFLFYFIIFLFFFCVVDRLGQRVWEPTALT
jgi:hypothetical protein